MNASRWRWGRCLSITMLAQLSAAAPWPKPARQPRQSKRSVPGSPGYGQLGRRLGDLLVRAHWRWPMLKLMNSLMLGVASAKQRQRLKQPKNDGIRPKSFASPVKSHSSRMIPTFGKRKRISRVLTVRARSESQVLGVASCDEPGTALARSGEGG